MTDSLYQNNWKIPTYPDNRACQGAEADEIGQKLTKGC